MTSPKNRPTIGPQASERKSQTEEHKQFTTIMDNLNNMRKEGVLCDVMLLVQGKHFPAHRSVLAAGSHFFSLMFTTRMIESTSLEVELRSAEPNTIELIIEFIYTARISVNSSNVQSLLDAANQYQIEPVKKMCVEFLKGQIDATNCLGISALADCMYCPELQLAAEDFFQLHFTEVYRLDEFLQLDVKRLTYLLHQDTLSVESEDQIYDAALRWLKYDVCNREQYMVEVLGCVRFPLVSKKFLSKRVKTELLIQDNPQCLKMIIRGMSCHLTPDEGMNSGEHVRPRQKKSNWNIAVLGGLQIQSTHVFNPKDCTWKEICCYPMKSEKGTAAYCHPMIYVTGGSRVCIMPVYNVLKKEWQYKAPPPINGDFAAACCSEGNLYISGGSIGKSTLDVFERFDTKTLSWQLKPSMLMARCCHGSVEANGLIYVCGGTPGSRAKGRVLNNCEVYDPSTQQWIKLPGMKEARKNHGLVVVNNRIYALGGQGATGGLDSVEYYDIATYKWYSVSPIPWRGQSLKCAAVGEIIYVLAGKGFESMSSLQYVLEYHTLTDRWRTCLKAPACSFPTCMTCLIDV